jgi:hypothetical protein
MNIKRKIIVDLDDTLLLYPDSDLEPEQREAQERYPDAMPNNEEIEILNRLYDAGNVIIIYTGRGWHNYHLTVGQLIVFGIKYHELLMGKPTGIWVDKDFKTSLKDII